MTSAKHDMPREGGTMLIVANQISQARLLAIGDNVVLDGWVNLTPCCNTSWCVDVV
jgi:hypothetical protein